MKDEKVLHSPLRPSSVRSYFSSFILHPSSFRMNLLSYLQERLRVALADLVADPAPYVSLIKPAADAKFGDYQANCAMSLAKVLGRKPREVAEEIVRGLPLDDALETPEIAGPGFINLRFKASWLAGELTKLGADE